MFFGVQCPPAPPDFGRLDDGRVVVPDTEGASTQDVATGRGPLYLRVTAPPSSDRAKGNFTTNTLTISSGILWHNPPRHNIFGGGDGGGASEAWNAMQKLLPASASFRNLLMRLSGLGESISTRASTGRSSSGAASRPGSAGLTQETRSSSTLLLLLLPAVSNEGAENWHSPMQIAKVGSSGSSDCSNTGSVPTSADWAISDSDNTQTTSPAPSQALSDSCPSSTDNSVGTGTGDDVPRRRGAGVAPGSALRESWMARMDRRLRAGE
ncbi:hypothetical protein B0T26DRAFT_752835 [Lasiosphaeria miniovina]|uniref:Uncharacterized protein n=1 Tax=Lasiosphaeria miniovina TaxID=1954250 RepID=A0AA40AB67_9PEZI|nr:uncharacterized protein B0T26DRAFT_752835 [Lasiosphaeria miniovina]KAK0712622.1 hypothetical protein B0T26DRAFT_752835 [Lasiosphaeria miniovina]